MTTSYLHNLYSDKNPYNVVMDEMIAACGGLNVETCMSTTEMKKLIPNRPHSAIADIRRGAAIVGALKIRYTGNRGDGGVRQDGTPVRGHGLKAYWTWLYDSAWMTQKLKDDYGLEFRAWDMEKHLKTFEQREVVAEQEKHLKAHEQRQTRVEAEPEVQSFGEEPESTIKIKMQPARKSDVEAIIEAARQYAGRESFIEEEIVRFHAMGIEIDRSAIKFSRDEVLEAMSPVVEYIDTLKRAIERQGEAVKGIQDLRVSQEKYDALLAENKTLKRERSQREQATEKLRSDMLQRTQAAERRARTLEAEVTRMATSRLQSQADIGVQILR